MDITVNPPIAQLGQIALVIAIAIFGGWLFFKILTGIFWVVGRFFAAIGRFCAHVGRFVGGMVTDTLRLVGHVIAAGFYFWMSMWTAGRTAEHYDRAFQDELRDLGPCLYRVAIGHLARFLLL